MTDVRRAPPFADDGGLAAFRRWWGDHAIAQAVALAFAVALVAWLAANVIGSLQHDIAPPCGSELTRRGNSGRTGADDDNVERGRRRRRRGDSRARDKSCRCGEK